jgi:glycosyltransferase involved in cell wall biosynthesis
VLAVADSTFNASELPPLGIDEVAVVPVLTTWERLRTTSSDPGVRNHLEVAIEGPIILNVGQLLPHKRPDLLIRAFHLFTTYHRPDAVLVLAGRFRLPAYGALVRALVRELNLPNVWLPGGLTDEELAACYRSATVFATLSEHEGFCVPLVEAMGFGVPCVARDHGAISETLDDAGLVLPAHAGPELVAEALAEVVGNDHLRADYAISARQRIEDYRLSSVKARFLAALEPVI